MFTMECLNAWRNTAANNLLGSESSFFKCSNCLYKYSFSRARLAKLVTSTCKIKLILLASNLCLAARIIFTLVIFFLLIFIGGYCLKYLFLKGDIAPRNMDPTVDINHEDLLKLLEMDRIDMAHFFFGTVFIGLVGFFVFFIQMIVFGTLTVIGLRLPIFTYHRETERIVIKDRADPGNAAAITIVIVIIGLGHSIYTIYSIVSKFSKSWLDALGAHILEVDE
ncbi:hypothetical protein DSO57_1038166 [Entomophthora muscae]|uniref:Uncharacterized protein n=1 Tax=Entomophthora muscae TaxID=34485 RepID=A0ACC2S0P8_9FUNG|nr:hypothetical protein DSO57_1038166 [Entomophthora muscae]